MKYAYKVKYNGVIYPAGTEVPVGNAPVEAKPEIKKEPIVEAEPKIKEEPIVEAEPKKATPKKKASKK